MATSVAAEGAPKRSRGCKHSRSARHLFTMLHQAPLAARAAPSAANQIRGYTKDFECRRAQHLDVEDQRVTATRLRQFRDRGDQAWPGEDSLVRQATMRAVGAPRVETLVLRGVRPEMCHQKVDQHTYTARHVRVARKKQ